ncbi:universal stress protein [Flavihumibacter sp. UBA7668]|uniref:universal stress protein n=1 Tax=Flavihumibacter sp. UBA7668 TaxID=1946542 RepID=UPI0025C4359F|nr:universal stress protein [Flavihumibacter sp. UBA7668]
MLKRILVPTDYSPTSERAFKFALELAARNSGTVLLYHVYERLEAGYIDNETKRTAYNNQMETDLVKHLNRLNAKYKADYPGVIVSTILGYTPIIDNILGFAEHNGIDIIIMGTQGASGLKKTLVGTIASRVVEKADLPVLLIPEFYEWKQPEKLVLATDYQPADKIALPILTRMAEIFTTTVTVVRLVSGHMTKDDADLERERFEQYTTLLKQEFKTNSLSFQLIATSSIVDALEHLDEEIQYDLLAMVRRKKNFLQRFFFESFTRNMAYLTRHPFLVVPDSE